MGFGDIRLDSALGQRLDAHIPLMSVSPDERRSLSVRMAGPGAFERFGIERAAVIDAITLAVDDGGVAGGRLALHLTSPQPIQEPFLNFLIVAETDSGRVLREYTVLLDPPGWTPRAASPVAAPRARKVEPAPAVSVAPPAPADNIAVPVVVAPAARDGRGDLATSNAVSSGRPDRYGPVEPGETLWSIAFRTRYPDVSTYQMLLAIYHANPAAFDGSINLLLKGAMLDIPPAAQVRDVDAAAARRIVAAARVAPAVPAPAPEPVPVEAPPVAPVPQAPVMAADTPADAGAEPQPTPEAAPVASGGRLQLQVPQQFPVIQSVETSAPVQPASADSGPLIGSQFGTLSSPPVLVRTATTPARADAVAATGAGQAAAAEATPVADAATPDRTSAPAEPLDSVGDVETTAADEGAAAGASDAGGKGDGAAEPWMTPGSVRDVAATRQAGLFSPSNILLLVAAAGLLVALLLWQRRRQYKPVPADFSAGFAAADGDDAVASGGAAEQAPAADQPAEHTGMPTVPGVSPELQVQDAENQIAIGLFDQARATIEDGLARYPGHAGLQDKLLELDYVNGDVERFCADVERFRSALVRNGVRWAGISAMGRMLAPEDPRFAFGKSEPEAAPAGQPETEEVAEASPFEPSAEAPVAATDEQAEMPVEDDSTTALQEEDDRAAEPPAMPEAGADDVQVYTKPSPEADVPDEQASSSGLDLDIENANLNDWRGASADEMDPAPQTGNLSSGADDLPDQDPVSTPKTSSANGRWSSDLPGDDDSSFDIDLSEFDLDKDTEAEMPAEEDAADPVETRLDVARMYIEMEDPGSARGLLYEVVEDGDAEQRETAQALLDQL